MIKIKKGNSLAKIFLFALFSIVSLLSYQHTAHANPLGNWDAGRIIEDTVFTNNGSMSKEQIDTFLKSKVPDCDTNGTRPSEFGGGTRAQWAASRGISPPFTCLKDYQEGGKSSAQIIYEVSNEFRINPQVLIVLLQKEQSLVTDTWPTNTQYKTATGYGCPDSTPGVCDSSYYGFTNQLRWAARMFRAIMNNSPTWYTPYVLGNNFIQYSPDRNCGGSTVTIQNRSTQALYNYTPYQPNQAALNAGYGSSSCGAYGNRNFYLYFTDWFGSTRGNQFEWSQQSISYFYDKEKIQPADPQTFPANTQIYVTLKARNLGWAWWANHGTNPVLLGTTNPNERQSDSCTSEWMSCSRASVLSEYAVAPGETGTFNFSIKTKPQTGQHTEYFNLLAENLSWMNGSPLNVTYTTRATYTWDFVSRQSYTNESKNSQIDLSQLPANTKFYQVVKVKNTGNTTWKNYGDSPVLIAPNSPNERSSDFCSSTWVNCKRTATSLEREVQPGGTATFEYWMQAPQKISLYHDRYTVLVENVAWMNDLGTYTEINTVAPVYNWQPVSSVIKSTSDNSPQSYLKKNTTYVLEVKVKNTGNVTWEKGGINLATVGPRDRSSQLWHSSWLSNSRLTTFNESRVEPNQTATFEATITTPGQTPTNIKESLGLVAEGITWMPDNGLTVTNSVYDGDYGWQYIGQHEYTDASGSVKADTSRMQKSTGYFVTVTAKNSGATTWKKGEIILSPYNPADRISIVRHDTWVSPNNAGTLLQNEVKPGEIGTFGMWIKTPQDSRQLSEYFELRRDTGEFLPALGLRYQFNTV